MERCDLCDRSFADPESLLQHIRDSVSHTMPFRCEPCNRSFKSQEALDQHSRDSPSHAISYDRGPCNRSFGSQNALEQHIQASPAHVISFHCELCSRNFGSQAALDQHIQDSPAHIALPTTPLDAFFLSFTVFEYDPDLPPSESFAQLQRFHGWRKGDPDDRQAWIGYQSALEEEVRLWFGVEEDLGAWHSICRAIGIEPLPATCARSKKVVRGVFVNIIDLIEWARSGRTTNKVQSFASLKRLREYTRNTGRIFSLSRVDNGNVVRENGNIVLRHLLRFIF